MVLGLLLVAVFTTAYAMFARRLGQTVITAPMTFLAFGWLLSSFDLIHPGRQEHLLYLVAELALIVLLFLDAAQINLEAPVSYTHLTLPTSG